MGLKERILLFISHVGVSKSTFERACGLSNGYVNNLKGSIGANKLEGILSAFPQLNRNWLLTGEGQMLLQSDGIHIGRNNMSRGHIGSHTTYNTYNTYNLETPRTEEYIENGYKITADIQATVSELISMIRRKDEDIRKLISMLQEKETLIKTLIEKADK